MGEQGRIYANEQGAVLARLTEAVLADPRHPYAWALANAVPRLDTPERLYTIGLAEPANYPSARRHASDQMFNYLTEERRLTPEDAYILFSAAVDLSFGGPAGAVVLASVPLDALAARDAIGETEGRRA